MERKLEQWEKDFIHWNATNRKAKQTLTAGWLSMNAFKAGFKAGEKHTEKVIQSFEDGHNPNGHAAPYCYKPDFNGCMD